MDIFRLDNLMENSKNPITGQAYDSSWVLFILTDSMDYVQNCGSRNGCAYAVRTSRLMHTDWKMAVCDFLGFHTANEKNILLVMTAEELNDAKVRYGSHCFHDPFLRKNEPNILIHSTSLESWSYIRKDGMLKCWNRLKMEGGTSEEKPIGSALGDPDDFQDYIMFGSGLTGEIVVNSRQRGTIIMDSNAEYKTGARLYFDAEKMAHDGLLIRDGCHLKVKDSLPLSPYLIWAATWDKLGLPGPLSTPAAFAREADRQFSLQMGMKTELIREP